MCGERWSQYRPAEEGWYASACRKVRLREAMGESRQRLARRITHQLACAMDTVVHDHSRYVFLDSSSSPWPTPLPESLAAESQATRQNLISRILPFVVMAFKVSRPFLIKPSSISIRYVSTNHSMLPTTTSISPFPKIGNVKTSNQYRPHMATGPFIATPTNRSIPAHTTAPPFVYAPLPSPHRRSSSTSPVAR